MAVSYGATFPVLVLLLSIGFTGYLEVNKPQVVLNNARSQFSSCYRCFQKWRAKMPSGIQWISGLSRGVATRVVLRLFVVLLCLLITLLMAILNFVSSSSDFECVPFPAAPLIRRFIYGRPFPSVLIQVLLPGNNCTALTNGTELEGLKLYTVPVRFFEKLQRTGIVCSETGTFLHFLTCIQTDSLFIGVILYFLPVAFINLFI